MLQPTLLDETRTAIKPAKNKPKSGFVVFFIAVVSSASFPYEYL